MSSHSFTRGIISLCLLFSSFIILGQEDPTGDNCFDAVPFCSNEGQYVFPNNTSGSAPVGPDYGCLFDAPAPIWYFFQIDEPGTLQLHLAQEGSVFGFTMGIDVDFAMWGPFQNLSDGCTEVMSGNLPPLQCSYSPSDTETIGLGLPGGYAGGASTPPEGQTGEIYILLLTNWDGAAGEITLEQTGGTGSTDCSIVEPCVLTSVTAVPSACDPSTNNFSVSGEIVFAELPTDGVLTIEDCNGNSTTLNAPFTLPITYTITDILSDGATCEITAYFENDETQCNKVSSAYTNPESCYCEDSDLSLTSINATDPICNNGCDGTAEIVVSGGEGSITYEWTNGQGETVGSSNLLEDLCAGNYEVVATDEAGCVVTGQASLFNPNPQDASFDFPDFCSNDVNGAVNVATPGGVFSFNPEPTDGATINPQTGEITGGVAEATYTVEYTPAGDCGTSSTQDVFVFASPEVVLEANPAEGEPPLIVDFNSFGEGNNTYTWIFGDASDTVQTESYSTSHTYYETGNFQAELIVENENGCSSTASVLVQVVYPAMTFDIPNVLTANEDNENDYFKLINPQNIKELHVQILNRWGVVVFEDDDVNFTWNGKVNNSGATCVEGTYFYKLNVTSLNGEEELKHGFLHLINGK